MGNHDLPARSSPARLLFFTATLLALTSSLRQLSGQVDAARDDYNFAAGLHDRGLHDRAVKAFETYLKKWQGDSRRPKALFYLGESLVALDREGEALPHFQASGRSRDNPLRGEARLRTGEILHRTGRSSEALAPLDALLADGPAPDLAAPALYLRGEASSATGDAASARTAYESVLSQHGRSSYASYAAIALGFLDYRAHAHDQALRRFKKAVNLGPASEVATEAQVMIGNCYLAQDKPREALAAFEKAGKSSEAERFSDQIVLGYLQARLALGEHEKALADYRAFRSRWPDDPRGHQVLVRAAATLHERGDDEAGLRVIRAVDGAAGKEARDVAYWSGLLLKSTGQVGEAILQLREALARQATPTRRFNLADALAQNGEFEEAIGLFRQVQTESKEVLIVAEAAFGEAYALNRLARYERAAEVLQELVGREVSPDLREDIVFALAENLFQLSRYQEAAAHYSRLLDLDKPLKDRRASCLYKRGWCHHLLGEHDAAIVDLERLVTKHSRSSLAPEARYLIGKSHESAGRPERARESFAALASEDSVLGTKALLGAGLAARSTGDRVGAEKSYRKAVEATRDPALRGEALAELGSLLAARGDHAGALHAFEALTSDHPKHPRADEARLGLAWALRSLNRHGEAEKQAAALALSTEDPAIAGEALYLQALEHHGQERYVDALRALNALDRKHANHGRGADALLLRGLAEARRGRPAEAGRAFEKLVARSKDTPGRATALYEWAFCLESQKQTERRDELFQQLLREHPQSPFSPDVTFRLGESAYESKDWERALGFYVYLSQRPGAGELLDKALYKAAWCQKKQERPAEAAALFDKVAEIAESPLSAESCFLAGEQLQQARQLEEAAQAFAKMATRHGGHALARPARSRRVLCLAELERWRDVIREAPGVLRGEGDSELETQVRSSLGDAFFATRAWDRARAAYAAITQVSEGLLAARAQFRIGLAHEEEGETDEAIDALLKVTILYAHPEWVAPATLRCGDLLAAKGQTAKARKLYEEILANHQAAPEAKAATARLANLDKQEGDR